MITRLQRYGIIHFCLSIVVTAVIAESVNAQVKPGESVAVSVMSSISTGEVKPVLSTPPDKPTLATQVYKIGVNDILSIELVEVPGVPRSVRVETDGTIAFPLAGPSVSVAGKTTTEAESMIGEAVKAVTNGGVRIKVVDYRSHTIAVWGLVGDPGDQSIQRDAVPFFVIKAMTSIDPRADTVRIIRWGSLKAEETKLGDPLLDGRLIYPGDSVEFAQAGDGGRSN